MKHVAYVALVALCLVGCTPIEMAAGGAGVLSGFMAYRETHKEASSPTPGEPNTPLESSNIWWYLGAGIGALVYHKSKKEA